MAKAPIALCEVQAYAYRAAMSGAELLDTFGRAGADEWREWAGHVKERFGETFWFDGPLGQYPAVGLDGDKRPIDSVTSGLGHLLGTGLLDAPDEKAVAAYLASPELDSGFGLPTLSSNAVGFNPLGYHTGSIWLHDTAIAIRGLATAGFDTEARSLIEGLLEAAPAFEYRLPQIFGGLGGTRGRPAPNPASCRSQAWLTAAAISLVQTLVGLRVDVRPGPSSRGRSPAAPSRSRSAD